MKLKRSMYLLVCILYLFTALTAGCTVRTNTDESKKPHETDIESSTSPPVITPAVGSGGDQDDGEPNGENISGPYAKPVFSEERVRKYIPSAYELPSFECRVPAYSTDIQLSNIVNLEQFGEFSQAAGNACKKRVCCDFRAAGAALLHLRTQRVLHAPQLYFNRFCTSGISCVF